MIWTRVQSSVTKNVLNDQNAETTIPRYCNNFSPLDQCGQFDICQGPVSLKKPKGATLAPEVKTFIS
jgi:hypothetical protein